MIISLVFIFAGFSLKYFLNLSFSFLKSSASWGGIPFLFMGRPHWDDSDYPTNYKKLDELMARASNDKYHLHIKKTLHLDYTDIPLMSPLIDHVMDVGNLSPTISLPLVNQLAHGFLEKHLLGSTDQILNRALMNKLIIRL